MFCLIKIKCILTKSKLIWLNFSSLAKEIAVLYNTIYKELTNPKNDDDN